MSLNTIKAWLRGLFPVVITLFNILFIAILCWNYWPLDTAPARLNYLGIGSIISQSTIVLWYFMNKFESISAKFLGNELKIDNGKGEDDGNN